MMRPRLIKLYGASRFFMDQIHIVFPRDRRWIDVIPFLLCIIFFVWLLWKSDWHASKTSLDLFQMKERQPDYCPSWYGISAYPKVSGINESWEWIKIFTENLPNRHFHMNSLSELYTDLSATKSHLTLNSLRFAGAKTVNMEDTYVKQLLDVSTLPTRIATIMSQYDCGYPKCAAKKRKLIFRKQEMAPITEDIIVLHGLITDLYDINRIVASLFSPKKILVTAITTLSSRVKENEENFASQLYDLLHRFYFDYDWLPVKSTHNCSDYKLRAKYGCSLWITWIAWNPHAPLAYIPPAGNGSAEMELQRQASFLNHPKKDACQVSQKIGGYRKSGSFIDGQYTLCLDSLRIAANANNCLVYSFGIEKDWTFDEAMHEAGCEVYSFDPSLGIPSHKRGAKHWFYNLGLRTNTGTVDPQWDLISYSEMRQRLNHATRKVNVLKMDIEGAEWTFLKDAMHDISLSFIDQVIFEAHSVIGPGNWRDLVRQKSLLFHYLEKRGFVLFNTRHNVVSLDLRSLDYSTKLGKERRNFMYELSFMKRPRQDIRSI